MKTILITTFISLSILTAKAQALFKIVQKGKIGYINERGAVIIKPHYFNGYDFADGVAAVRENGFYGFIDTTGKYLIKPQYDFATNFVNGLTVVYKEGQPYFINKAGTLTFPTVYKSLAIFNNGTGIITTKSNKQGLISIASKRLLIDTVFGSISDFKYGTAIVNEYVSPGLVRSNKVGVIDSTGKFIVPFGKYETIRPFFDGFAVVKIEGKNDNDDTSAVINTKGEIVFKRADINNSSLDGDIHEGYIKASLYKYWLPQQKGTYYTGDRYYEGFFNMREEIVLNDTNYEFVNEFSSGRCFVKNRKGGYILLDRNFKRVGNNTFSGVVNDGFKNGYAIVESAYNYGIIDTTGNYVVQPKFDEIADVGVVDGYFFFANDGDDDDKLYGVADIKGNIIIKPILQQYERDGFINGLLKTVVKDKLTYFNKKGHVLWQQKNEAIDTLKHLNIDFMNRGYFYAYSSGSGDNSGGWAVSPNKPAEISPLRFIANELSVTIDTTNVASWQNKYEGYKLFISNNTGDTVKFNAQDSRLYMKLQALNDKGEWKDIEYLPSSWCGNSYHVVELAPRYFWGFTIPKYFGEFKTKIRAQLKFIDPENNKVDKVIYSNAIDGRINPGQFWNKLQYNPSGIMDPYYD